jgi:hypothetical protein
MSLLFGPDLSSPLLFENNVSNRTNQTILQHSQGWELVANAQVHLPSRSSIPRTIAPRLF